ncbi:MAG: AmmeMemoRadiSam system protein B, partial [Phycisphaerae bacterium]|nr:AmmeMemoRadiSam system protein B [Phycisphaerae bacterium]
MDKQSEKSGSSFAGAVIGVIVLLLVVVVAILTSRYFSKVAAKIRQDAILKQKSESKTEAPQPKEKQPTSPKKIVLPSSLAGKWYDTDAEALSKEIAGYYQKAEAKPISNVIALILPHAGYRFSGQIAVRALKTADKKYSRIIVIGPSHTAYMEEMLSVPGVTHYETPLGQVPLDVDFINKLLE